MIRTIADLLDQLRRHEEKALAAFDYVEHGPMIGDMYEGLTRELLERSLFEGLDLRVVSGKVRWSDGRLSSQLDCMVVVGKGERLPYTEHYIYPLRQTMAVIGVKKTLYSSALEESYDNLRSVSGSVLAEQGGRSARPFIRAFRTVAQHDLPDDGNLTAMSFDHQMLAEIIRRDAILPVRVVLGYSGYSSERTLRDGFLRLLQKALEGASSESKPAPVRGYGPSEFPSLVASGNAALLKTNGMPYAMSHDGPKDEWLCYASSHGNVTILLLELLWTRLASVFDLPAQIFGEDLDLERLSPLLYARAVDIDGVRGWLYRAAELSPRELAGPPTEAWSPMELNSDQAALLTILGECGSVDTLSDASYMAFRAKAGDTVEPFLMRLRIEGIAAIGEDGRLRFLTDQCNIAFLPDGRAVVAEDSTGRLTRWVARELRGRQGER